LERNESAQLGIEERQHEAAGPKEWLGLGVLALTTLLLALDFSVLHLALPHIVADLQPSGTQQLWILDIYGFMIAGFLVTMGTFGDRIGRKKLLMIGAFAFGVCSIAAAFSSSAEMLIATRALLGIAGATLMPSTLSLIGNMFKQPRQRGLAIAIWLSCFSAGGAIGPLVGGLMLEWFWWGSVFLLGVPVMLALLVTAPFVLPEFRDRNAGKLDLVSALLSLLAVLFVIYALKEMTSYGPDILSFAMLVLGLDAGCLFIRRQRMVSAPLLDLRFFRSRVFNGALIGLFVAVFALGGFVLYFAQYLQLVVGLSPLEAGLWMIPYAVANIAGAMTVSQLAGKLRVSRLIAGGLALAIVGFLSLQLVVWLAWPGLATMAAGSILIMLGFSPVMVLGTDLIVSSVPPEKAGSASSLSEMSSELGMALGVAVMGSIGAAVYRQSVAGSIPEDMSPDTAAAVGDSLAGALSVAADHTVLESASDAFMSGFQVMSGVSAALLLGLIVLCLRLLRDKPL